MDMFYFDHWCCEFLQLIVTSRYSSLCVSVYLCLTVSEMYVDGRRDAPLTTMYHVAELVWEKKKWLLKQ